MNLRHRNAVSPGTKRWRRLGATLSLLAFSAVSAEAQCPEEPALLNYTGAGTATCNCFAPGEEAGVILDAPAAHYPIEILKIRIGWGSAGGGAPPSLEQAIHLYAGVPPSPGVPQFSLLAPALTDGFLNEFDISGIAGNKIINSGPFLVSLEFANDNQGSGPTTVHDNNGCTFGRNSVFIPGTGWIDACILGISGDWVMEVVYRQVTCGPVGGGDCEVQAFCFGGFDAGACPCGNTGTGIDGCLNTSGASGAVLAVQSGSFDVAAEDLEFLVAGLPSNFGQAGLLFTNVSSSDIIPGVAVSDGLLCVGGGPRLQLGLSVAPGLYSTTTSLNGINMITEANLSAPGFFVAGSTYSFQFFYRDQVPVFGGVCGSPTGAANMSNALRIQL